MSEQNQAAIAPAHIDPGWPVSRRTKAAPWGSCFICHRPIIRSYTDFGSSGDLVIRADNHCLARRPDQLINRILVAGIDGHLDRTGQVLAKA